jgi:alpha-tubulin suppressor-like RCC1 family protein
MPNQFLSPEGDLENYFVTEYFLIDQYVGDTLLTWGDNTSGQLGNNTSTARSTPVTTFAGGTDWKQVSGGYRYTAAIKTDGTLWTWGRNTSGQLGNNTIINRFTPVTTFAGGTNWKQVSGGYGHTAAIKTDGTLWTWGANTSGELGRNPDTSSRLTPVTTFAGGTNWADTATTDPAELYTLSCGGRHTAAIKTDGTLWTWGLNGYGQLGDNTSNAARSTPVTTFAGGTNWKQVSGGGRHTAAIKADGTLWTWGLNASGQLGNNTSTARSTPVTTRVGGTDWKQVAGGRSHTAAIKTDGTLWTWGLNSYGQLGINTSTARSVPVTTFAGGTNWKQVSGGYRNTAAIKTDGTLWTWGFNYYGAIGDNTSAANTARTTPVTTFAGGTNWKQVACGGYHIVAIKTDGTLWTWGLGTSGQLGDNTSTDRSTPVTTFAGGTNWKQVSCGGYHTAAIKTDGTLWTWGRNTAGQLGDDTIISRSTPVTTFAGGTNWKQVSCGYEYTAALNDDGTNKVFYLWGNNTFGQLGTNWLSQNNQILQTFAGGTNWKQVAGGGAHTAAVKTDGTLWTWGLNTDGQLGDNTSTARSTPVTTFAGGTNWKQVACGSDHTAAIKTDGTLWTVGLNGYGQLGRNSDTSLRLTPVTTFAGGTNWADTATGEPEELYTLSCGRDHTAAIKTDGTLWTWGSGTSGQLGDNTSNAARSTPVTTFAGGTNWKQVFGGGYHTAAIKADGTLWTWGSNFDGQLGNNTSTARTTPVTTFAGGTDWKQVAGGRSHTAAIKTDGTLWTWGLGTSGQLGDNTIITRSTPVTTFAGGTDWKQVACGDNHTVAIKTDGTLWTWGSGTSGQLGTNTVISRSTPVTTFAGGTNWKQVFGGYRHTAAIKTDGTLWTWGANGYGRLGDNTIINRSIPVTTFAGGTNWKQVSGGGFHTAAIKTDGTLWTWGRNSYGNLGDDTIISRSTPVTTFAGGTNWKQVAGGRLHTAALNDDGTNKILYLWGNNTFGQLGTNWLSQNNQILQTFAGGTNWKQVACGSDHTAAIKTDGTLWTWGVVTNGRLGNNTTITNRFTPVTTFAGGTNWKQVACGSDHTAAIKTDGTLWTWGANTSGQLGTNNTADRRTPVTTFAGGTNWKQVAGGGNHTAVVTSGTDPTYFIS